MAVKTNILSYKSYKGREFRNSNGVPSGEPSYLIVKVFATKKPKAEISVLHGWFSESRGFGGTSGDKLTVTGGELYGLCVSVLNSDAALMGLIDKLAEAAEHHTPGTVAWRIRKDAARWWVLANHENPTDLVDEERKNYAFNNKRFKIGDVVYATNSWNHRVLYRLTGERFDWHCYLGGGWRFSVPGCDAPQERWGFPTEGMKDWPVVDSWGAAPPAVATPAVAS